MTTPTATAPNGWYGPAAPLADKPRLLGELRAASSGARLGLAVEPSLLSIWSGALCPVDASTLIGDGSVGAALAYIDHLLHQEWTPGAKYFYGHRVG